MPYIFVEQASIEGALPTGSREHCIILSSSSVFGPLKSKYISHKRGSSAQQWLWERPFGDKIMFSVLPRELMVTLHRRGRIWDGPDVESFILECSSDCTARPVLLSPANAEHKAGMTMRLTVTISGNPANTAQNAPPVPFAGSTTGLLPTEGPLTTSQSPGHAPQITSNAYSDWQATAEVEVTKASEDLVKVNPQLTQYMVELPASGGTVATHAATGLVSIMFQLDGIVHITNLLADIHPLVKGAWSLVSAAYQVARAQADLDTSVEALIDAMDDGCRLAKGYAPLNGRHSQTDSIVRDLLREVIKGASVVKVYCEKRPKSLSALRTLASNLAQEVEDCSQALSALKQKFLARVELRTLIQIEHIAEVIDRSTANEDLKGMKYAEDANRALWDGSRGCLFGTRTELIDVIRDWAAGALQRSDLPQYLDVLDPEGRVLWLCGVAGAGKSSIAISVAKALWQMGILGSLYSFQAAKQATLNPTNLFSTIARHLAQHNSIRRQALISIIREIDPIMRATSSPKDQFEQFLLAILAHSNSQTVVEPTVIVIDAFDECGNLGNRSEVLEVLARRIHELPAGVRFIITSRFEDDVQRALEHRPSGVCLLKMENIPGDSTRHDIHAYVRDTLKHVRGLESEKYVPKLTQLAVAAEESFQWASTACLFIKNEDDGDAAMSPRLRLGQVLQSNAGLDPLYRMILDRHFGSSRTETMQLLRSVLGYLVCAYEPLSLRTIISLSPDLSTASNVEFDSDDYHRLAQKLSSLVTGTQDLETPLLALHTSFTDFLADRGRSHDKYFVASEFFHERITSGCLRIMLKSLRFNICDLPTSFRRNRDIDNLQVLIRDNIPDALSYASRFWAHHLSNVPEWYASDAFRPPVTQLLGDRFLEWLEIMSLTGNSALELLERLTVAQEIPFTHHPVFNLIHETIQFATYFAVPIAQSAAHIYLSALPFTPTGSFLHGRLSNFRGTVQISSGGLVAWPSIRHVLQRHTRGVRSVAFSPVGALIASGSDDRTVRLWDRTRGHVNGVLEGHSLAVRSIAFSPDGALLASGSDDCEIRIWDVKSCTMVGEPLKGHADGVRSVMFSSDGTLIVSGSGDYTIRVWDVGSHTTVGEPFKGHDGAVHSVVFSPNSTHIASGSDDGTIRIWDVESRTAVGEPLEGHNSSVRSITFSPDGTLLASGSDDRTIRLWDVKSLTVIGEPLKSQRQDVRSVVFSPNSALITWASGDNTIRIWDVKSRTAVGKPLQGHRGRVNSVAFSADGMLVASGSDDSTVRVWDVGSRPLIEENPGVHNDFVNSAAFSPNGAFIASGSSDRTIRLWDATLSTVVGDPFIGHTDWVRSVAFSPDSTLIASGSDDGAVRIWNVQSHSQIGKPLTGHYNGVLSVAFSPDGTLIVSGSIDHTIRLWSVNSHAAIGGPFKGHGGRVNSVVFSPNGTHIASGSDDHTIRIWDVKSRTALGDPMHGHNIEVRSVTFSPDGTFLASGSYDCTIRIWDVQSRTQVGDPLFGHGAGVLSVAFSPDGARIASGSADHTIRIWDVKSRQIIGVPLEGHSNWVRSVTFSPKDSTLVSGSEDHTVRIWDARPQATIADHPATKAESAAFPPTEGLPPAQSQQSLAGIDLSLPSLRRLQDGWIVGPEGELILWIPPSQRLGLGEYRMLAVLGRPEVHSTLLNFDNMACGTEWAKCRTLDSADTIVEN